MAKLRCVTKEEDYTRLRKHRRNGTSIAAVILCLLIVPYGCTPVPAEKRDWVTSPSQPKPSQFDYLPERANRIIPLVVQQLRQTASQESLDALECMANSPIDKVTIGESESLEFRDLLTQIFAEFKTERQRCLPLSGQWQVIAMDLAHVKSGPWAEFAGPAASLYATSCLISLGLACPVPKSFHLEFATRAILRDGQNRELVGAGHSDEWSMVAWQYKAMRDEAFAEFVSEALLALAIQYSEVATEILLDCSEVE